MIIKYLDLKVWIPLLVVLIFSLGMMSCQRSNTNTDIDTVILLFPQQLEANPDSMEALLEGRLVLVSGCLRVQDSDNNNYLLIWPQGFSPYTEDGGVQVKDATGQTVVQVGDNVKVTGGEISSAQIDNYAKNLSNDCTAPYWIVASIEK